MSNKDAIIVRYYGIRNLAILEFLDSDNSFFLGKNDPALGITDIETTYNLIGLTEKTCNITKREARKLWNRLIKDNFEQMSHMDDMMNGTNNSAKKVDEALFCFKIRDKNTGKYSKGGSYDDPSIWNNQGKTWNQINHVKSHMTHLLCETQYQNNKTVKVKTSDLYEDAELVILKEVRSVDLNDDNIEKVKDEVKKHKRRR